MLKHNFIVFDKITVKNACVCNSKFFKFITYSVELYPWISFRVREIFKYTDIHVALGITCTPFLRIHWGASRVLSFYLRYFRLYVSNRLYFTIFTTVHVSISGANNYFVDFLYTWYYIIIEIAIYSYFKHVQLRLVLNPLKDFQSILSGIQTSSSCVL